MFEQFPFLPLLQALAAWLAVAAPFAMISGQGQDAPAGALSRVQAAEYLSISTRKLDDLLTAGDIPKIKLGRKTLIRVCDLDEFLARLAGEVRS